jgi:hypothetical protein
MIPLGRTVTFINRSGHQIIRDPPLENQTPAQRN